MKRRALGSTGLMVSEISLGGWMTFGERLDQDATNAVIRAAVDRGVNLFDTADSYSKGKTERAMGAAFAGVPRAELVLSTKVFWPTGDDPRDQGLAPARIRRQIDFSLANLRTDYVDLYFCHHHDPAVPMAEIVGTMNELIRAGKVRHWGTSNWPHHAIAAAWKEARRAGLKGPAVDQPGYSLLHRDIERWLFPTAAANGMAMITYAPLAGGMLAGGFRNADDVSAHRRAQARNRGVEEAEVGAAVEKARRLERIAERVGAKPAQVAIAWLLTRGAVSSVITGASSVQQIEENAAAAEVRLDAATVRELGELFPPARRSWKDRVREMGLWLRPAVRRRLGRWRA